MLKLIKNTGIYVIGRMLPQAAGLILLPVYTNYLSPQQYGIVESMLVLNAFLSILFSMATERSLFRLYYDYKTIEAKKKLVGNITILILISGILLLGSVFLLREYISKIYSNIDFYPYFVYSIVTAYGLSFAFIPQTLLQVQEKAMKFALMTILAFSLEVICILFFVIVEKQEAEGLLKGKMIATMLMLPIYIYIIKKNSIFSFNQDYIKSILTFSLPMLLVLLTSWVNNMSNRIFIEQFFNLTEVGLFSIAFKITSVVSIFLGALFTAYNPMFYRLANDTNQSQAKAKIVELHNLLAIVVLLAGFLLVFFAKEIIILLLDEKYQESVNYIPILTLSVILVQLTGFHNLMIYQNKKSNIIMIIALIGSIFSITLNFIFIPSFGAYGAAWVAVVTSTIILLITIYASKQHYYIQINYKNVILFMIIGSLLILLNIKILFSPLYFLLKLLVVLGISTFVYKKIVMKLG